MQNSNSLEEQQKYRCKNKNSLQGFTVSFWIFTPLLKDIEKYSKKLKISKSQFVREGAARLIEEIKKSNRFNY